MARSRAGSWTLVAWPIAAVAVALAAQLLLHRATQGIAPLATFYPAVAVAALKSGRTGAVLAGALSLLVSWYFLMGPRFAFSALSSEDVVRMLLFVGNAGIIAEVCARYRLALDRARGLEFEATRSAKLLEAIGAASPDLIYAKDRQFRTIYANPATLRVLGRPAQEIVGRAASEYASVSEEGEAHAGNDARVMESGEVEISDETFTSPDGTSRVFRSSKAPLRDAGGEIIGIAGVSIDITEQREMEDQLRRSEQRLRLALAAGRMAVWDLDHVTDKLTGSPELNRLLGFDQGHPLDIAEIRVRYYPGDRDKLLAATAEALARGDTYAEGEFRYHHPDGSLHWFVISAELGVDEAGKLARSTGVMLDITNLKKAESDLAEREIELKAALEAGRLAIVDYDHETKQFRHSPRLSELYGYAPDHRLTIEDVRARYHPENAHAVYEQLARDSAADDTQFHWLIRLQMPDLTERWVEGVGEYVRTEGRISRSRGIAMDVTERVRSERHQRLLIAELNHRVKNTLAIVQGLAHQSFQGGNDPAVARRAFEGRLEALAAAHSLLTKERWETANLSELIDTALRPHVGQGQRIVLEGPPVRLDPKLAVSLSMAIHELATNAVKYGSLSAQRGEVAIRWSRSDDDEPRLRLTWQEAGGPPVQQPSTRGFGTKMIERALASDLQGRVELCFHRDGLVCEIDAPFPVPILAEEAAAA